MRLCKVASPFRQLVTDTTRTSILTQKHAVAARVRRALLLDGVLGGWRRHCGWTAGARHATGDNRSGVDGGRSGARCGEVARTAVAGMQILRGKRWTDERRMCECESRQPADEHCGCWCSVRGWELGSERGAVGYKFIGWWYANRAPTKRARAFDATSQRLRISPLYGFQSVWPLGDACFSNSPMWIYCFRDFTK